MLYFETYQDLPTKGIVAIEQFSIDGSLFLGFANSFMMITTDTTQTLTSTNWMIQLGSLSSIRP